MSGYTDKNVRDFLRDKVEAALSSLGVIKVYADSESVRRMKKFDKSIAVLHRSPTELNRTIGPGVYELISPYTICWICPKDEALINVVETHNEDKLSDFVTALGNKLEASVTDTDCPFSGTPTIATYGMGNEEDPIGLPGTKTTSYIGVLFIYATFNIKHRRIFNCS